MMSFSLRPTFATGLGAMLAIGLIAGTAVAQQAQPAQPRNQRQQQPQQPAAAPTPAQRPAATPLTPALQQQLERDVLTCWAGTDVPALERACTNSLARQNNIQDLTTPSRGRLYYNRATGRLGGTDVAGAIDDLRKSISDDFNPQAAYTRLGGVYLDRQPDLVQAESSYRKALELNPGFRDARLGLALTLLRKRDTAGKIDITGAVREINAALEASPSDAELHYHKGAALSQGTSIADAVKSLDEALRLRPGYVDALFLRAQLNMSRGQRARAIEDFNAIVATNPNDSRTLANLGATLTQLKQYDRAIQVCERAVQLDVKNVTAHVCLGLARTDQGLFPKALEDFERALQWDANSAVAHVSRGYLHKRTGNFDSAIADFKRALEIDKRSEDALRHLISVYTDKGELDKALLAFEEANNINRNDAWNYYLRSFVWALRNDATRAKKDIDQAFTIVGNADSEAHLARAAMYYFLADTQAAIRDVREAIRINPDNGQAHKLLARALLKQRDLRGAEASLRRAQELLPNDWNVFRSWGLLDLARNNFAAAKENFEKSIDLNPAFIEAFVGLGRAYEGLGNVELAKSQYQLGQAKLDYDVDGRESREEARRRMAALADPKVAARDARESREAPSSARGTTDAPTASGGLNTPTQSGRTAEPVRTRTAEGPEGDPLVCRLFKGWAGHARDYTGVQFNVGCRQP